MKRLISILIAIAMLVLVGCISSGVSQAEYDALKEKYEALKADYDVLAAAVGEVDAMNQAIDEINETADPFTSGNSPQKTVSGFSEEAVLQQLEAKEFHYVDSIKNAWVFLVVKNNSEYDLQINANLKTYDASGNLIGAKSASQEAFEHGTETMLTFMLDEVPEKTEYEFSVSEEDWYECVVSDLSYETNSAKKKEVVFVTNNGDKPAEFVEGCMLFLQGGQVVGYTSHYFVDDDSELKPGKTISGEMNCYKEYDSFILCLTGRR